jgi:hypothetical protein
MNKLALIGIVLIVAGGVLIGFEKISDLLVTAEGGYDTLNILEIFGEDAFKWLNDINIDALKDSLTFVVEAPLYMIFFVLGGVFLLASGFIKK